MRQHPSKVSLVLSVHRKNSSRRGNAQLARRRLKREIVKMCWHVLTRFPQAREQSSTRARLLDKEIIQTRMMRLNKISARARTESGARNWAEAARVA